MRENLFPLEGTLEPLLNPIQNHHVHKCDRAQKNAVARMRSNSVVDWSFHAAVDAQLDTMRKMRT